MGTVYCDILLNEASSMELFKVELMKAIHSLPQRKHWQIIKLLL